MDMQAKHNVDFIGGEGDLTFNHGETSKTLSFAIMDSMVKNYFYYLKFRHSIPIYVNITVIINYITSNSDILFPFT